MNILKAYLKEVDFIFHLAGVNRPKEINEFYKGNSNLTKFIVETLKKANKSTSILLSSSIQAEYDNDYGKSKHEAEQLLIDYSKSTKAQVFIYRLPNVFGKWSKPNYNTVIATWCFNLVNNRDIEINDKDIELSLVYIDDVVNSFIEKLNCQRDELYCNINTMYQKTLGELLFQFKNGRKNLLVSTVGFERALYATYLSFISTDDFSYEIKGFQDERGTFYEILKTINSGQFSISTTAPGITRGNHYHHTKNEKFLVVKGKASIEYRHIITNERIKYEVSDQKMEIVEMIPGYTHNITNTGNEEMILFLWANEVFDNSNPDTYFLKV